MEKIEESKNDYNIKNKMYNDTNNKLIESNDFFFNYRNDEAFNKINILETKPLNKNYNNECSKRFIKNVYSNYKKENKYYDLKNSVNSIDSMKMREILEEEKEVQNQIKYEEIMLKNLKEEKNKLLEEEKKRREMLLIEINKNKNKIEEKKEEIQEILYECKKEKQNLKIKQENKDINKESQNKRKYYREYLEKIRERNELINQTSNNLIKQNIYNENNEICKENQINNINYNIYNSYNKYKKIRKINDNIYNNGHQLNIIMNNKSTDLKRRKNDKKDKINLNSYFQLNEKEKEKKFNYTSSSNIMSKVNSRKNNLNSTPEGLYRNNETDIPKEGKNKIYKILSTNNYNSMTQTRFYRGRINPDELISNYAKEKIMNFNSSRNKIFARNKDISSFLDYEKFGTNPPTNSNYMNLNESKDKGGLYLNYSNNVFLNKRSSIYKTNSFLEKGKSYSNLQSSKENDLSQIEPNYTSNYLCDNCLRKKILFNENLNNFF